MRAAEGGFGAEPETGRKKKETRGACMCACVRENVCNASVWKALPSGSAAHIVAHKA